MNSRPRAGGSTGAPRHTMGSTDTMEIVITVSSPYLLMYMDACARVIGNGFHLY
jgi:hypothetical protein